MAEILPNSPNDVASRGVTNTTLAQFKGLARQVVINVDDGFRPVIMDGLTLGGKFFCASKAEVEAVKTTANNALTKTKADGYYLGKSAKAVSAGSADTATSAGKWTTARTLTLAGGATGSVSINGSTNVTLNVTSIAGAKVTGTVSSATTANFATTANSATTATSATTANSVAWSNVSGRPDPVIKSGNRGSLSGYEASSTQTSLSVNASSPDSIWYNSTAAITVNNGTGGQAWVKTITLNQVPSIHLGGSWAWVNGETPTLRANGTVVLSWNNTRGIASFLSPSA